jgi:hypothetical protein
MAPVVEVRRVVTAFTVLRFCTNALQIASKSIYFLFIHITLFLIPIYFQCLLVDSGGREYVRDRSNN